ncbi:hypothetical protein HKX48_007100 [Thoreauomyces humboldtii]|nr:hypothetical protein HKX48_007100 [Thoreauomyces humboldtii]
MILGDYGAEIIKVELPGSGDDTRAWGPPFATNASKSDTRKPDSAYFLGVNRNKKSLTVNFKSQKGREIISRLARKADILIENHVPGKLDAWGLGYEDLKKANPRLIYASITGYGPTGPYAHRPGYDVITEAEAGLMGITGDQDGPPAKAGVAVVDLLTGLYAHGAVLAALLSRATTGVGQKIDVSLLETQVASLANIGHSYLIGGVEAKRWGTQHASIVPYQAFPTQDSHLVVGAGNDGQFRKLCNAIGRPDLPQNPKFANNSARVAARVELIEILSDVFRSKPNEAWLDVLADVGIPFSPVNSIAQAFAHPQVEHREMVQEVDHPQAGKIRLVGIPVKFSETKPTIRSPPPVLGQHTAEVLREYGGYTEAEIADLQRTGAV